ncbi:globin [Sulfuricurvum sp.]|uniref:globin domain-containing protein n=1 Tax=Sulfuricurvum sp. TaxID=2025608 RepID=UPI002E2F86FD|nr:globin [Sulfuricurvum sp.]HEX5328968.1 globin [Sulfuricurvum sp.]
MTFITSEGKPVSQFSACGTKPFEPASMTPHTAEAKIDFVYPEVPFPTIILYQQWGEENIRNMVRYHHGLLRKSAIGNLFPADDAMFTFATEKTADFFVEALGGEKVYTPVHGHPALRMRHFHITVDEKGREIWLMMYKKTINDLGMPSGCIEEFWNWIEPLSIRMINRRTTVAPIERHPYSTIWGNV